MIFSGFTHHWCTSPCTTFRLGSAVRQRSSLRLFASASSADRLVQWVSTSGGKVSPAVHVSPQNSAMGAGLRASKVTAISSPLQLYPSTFIRADALHHACMRQPIMLCACRPASQASFWCLFQGRVSSPMMAAQSTTCYNSFPRSLKSSGAQSWPCGYSTSLQPQ